MKKSVSNVSAKCAVIVVSSLLDRVEALRKLANELQLQESVRIMTNISFNQLLELLSVATVGIHTMSNEHFGIGKS